MRRVVITLNNRQSDIQNAIDTLITTGIIARSKEEAEILECYRKLSLTSQQLELARIRGMVQAMIYAKAEWESNG